MIHFFLRLPILLAPISSLFWWLAYPGGGGFWPLAFIMLVPLLVAVYSSNTLRQALFCGLITGVIHYIFLLYWIVNVLGQYGGLPWFASIPAFLLMAFANAAYLGLFCSMAYLVMRKFPLSVSVWLLPCGWVGVDWLRSILFSGFPWMDPAYALWQQSQLIQVADLFGHYGVTFLLVLVNVLLAQLLTRQSWRKKSIAILISVFLLLVASGYSVIRHQQVMDEIDDAKMVRVGIVQGNIPQEMKWSKDRVQRTLGEYHQKSLSLLGGEDLSFMVWPETAVPFYPKYHSAAGKLRKFIRENRISLITGSPWFEPAAGKDVKNGSYYNAAILFEPSGKIADTYFKSHLVPFGEYVPLAKYLFFIKPLVEAVGRFSPGEIEHPLSCKGAEVGVLICFESIFPEISRKWVKKGANVLANLTNDAWYGFSSAPHHSLAMTVFRAIETRRSIIRAANTGFSGFIDPLGRLAHKSSLFQSWAKSEDVVLFNGETMYVRYGYLFGPFCFMVGMIATFAAVLWKREK